MVASSTRYTSDSHTPLSRSATAQQSPLAALTPMQSSAATMSTRTHAPSSMSNSSPAWWLPLLAASGGVGALLGFLAGRRIRSAARHQSSSGALPSCDLSTTDLPPVELDEALLAALQLGSDELRELFYLNNPDRAPAGPGALPASHRSSNTLFCNHGSYGTIPRPVLRYYISLLHRVEQHPDLWFRSHSWIMTRAAIQPFAQVLRCPVDSLVFVNNATSGVNAVLQSLDLQPGDAIIALDCTYNACKLAMSHVAQLRGAKYVEFALPLPLRDEQQVLAAFEAEVARLQSGGVRVRLALVDAITSPTSIVLPWMRVCALLRRRGVLSLVDGAHALNHIDVDLSCGTCDYFVTNCHKWAWGVKGSALLYAAPHLREQLRPLVTSHSHGESFARRFWMQGTRDDAAYIAAFAGLRFAQTLGIERAQRYTARLADEAAASIAARLRYSAAQISGGDSASTGGSSPSAFICPSSMRAPNMRLVRLPWRVPGDASLRGPLADRMGMALIQRFDCVCPIIYEAHTQAYWLRFSVQVYNRPADYERLIDCVLQLAKDDEFAHILQAQ